MRRRMAVVVYAMDVDRMSAFYSAVLDAPVERPDPTFAILTGDGWELVVNAIPAPYAEDIEITDPPQVREDTPIKAVLPVADLGRARATAAAFGGSVRGPDQEWAFRGLLFCDGVDPEGNVFQLVTPQDDLPRVP